MNFKYWFKAVDFEGKVIVGNISSQTRKDVLLLLEKRGLYPIIIRANRYASFLDNKAFINLLKKLGLREYSFRDLMIFCRQLSTMLKAGIPVLHTLHSLSGQLDKAVFRRRVEAAALTLEQGTTFSEALEAQKGFFPPLLVSMVDAGETGGVLDEVLERVADHYEKQHDLEEKIRSSTAYPIFITAVALVVMAVMIIFVLPQFSNIFNQMGMEMPFLTRLMLSAGNTIYTSWLYILFFFVLFFVIVSLLLKHEKVRFVLDKLKPRLPLYGKIYVQIKAARFARTLGTLLSSGVSLHIALQLADRVIDNRAISKSIGQVNTGLHRGEQLTDRLIFNPLFPSLLVEMIRIGEETGNLEYTLGKTADYYEKEVSYLVDRLSSILEPVLLLIVGLFIGLLVFSILSPMYRVFEMI